MNNEINFVSPFKRLCITIGNLPTAYLESMSYYEGLTYLVNYLSNNVIPAVNNNGEVVKEVQEQYIELKNYVDNYFENLDIQTEINNKLDEMAEQGELSTIIIDYLQMSGLMMYDTLTDMKATEHVIDGSFLEIAGKLTYNDGKRALYRVRELEESDVADNDLLVELTNYPSLIAEKLFDEEIEKIGNLSNLTTTDKTTIVSSINEVNANVGDLTGLTTTDKSDLVSATNEINSNVGDLDNLTTTADSSTVNAINEVNSNVGNLSSLTTSTKSSIVGAINELNSYPIFNFTHTYKAIRDTSDNDTAQITIGKFFTATNTFTATTSGLSTVNCNIQGATNADGSVGKIYGQWYCYANYQISASNGYPCLRLRCSDFGISVPSEGYSIWSAGTGSFKNILTSTIMYIGSDGYIYLYAPAAGTADNDLIKTVHNPCIYFWKSFGDTPE